MQVESARFKPGCGLDFRFRPSLPQGTVGAGSRCSVEGAPDRQPSAVQDVGVNHRRLDILVSEQFLDRSDVVTGFKQMGGETVRGGVLPDPLLVGAGILPVERVREIRPPIALTQIFHVELFDPNQMLLKGGDGRLWQDCVSVLAALCVPDHNLTVGKVQVLYP